MTITTNPTRNEYTASAGQTVFSYTFKIFADTDLNVYLTSSGTNPDDTTDLITAYTVTGVGSEDGGTITLTTPASAGDLITIVSDIPESRTTDYQNNGDFRPSVVNDDFDRIVSLVKQAVERSNRGLAFQESQQNASGYSLPTPEAGYFLRWNGALNGLENVPFTSSSPGSDSLTVSSLANVTDANTGDWRYVLGKSTIGDGGQGVWVLTAGDYTSELAADTLNGVYLEYSGEDGSTRAWVRQYSNNIDPRWFGAKNDGTTDCTVSVQAAIDFARGSTTQDNAVVEFTSGRWLITDTLNIGPGTKIKGVNGDMAGLVGGTSWPLQLSDSKGTVIIFAPTSEKSLFVPSLPKGGSSAYSGICIEGLNIWGNSTPDAYHRSLYSLADVTYSKYCFDFNEVHYSVIRNCAVFGFQNGLRLGDRNQENSYDTILIAMCRDACVLYTQLATIVFPTSDIFTNCVFRTSGYGVRQIDNTVVTPSYDSLHVRFVNCMFEDISTYGVFLPRGVANWEFVTTYCEQIGMDSDGNGTADNLGAMFRIGTFGTVASPDSPNISIIGGQFVGSNTNTFLALDDVSGINVVGFDVKNVGTVISTTANTRDYSIYLANMTCSSIGTFHGGTDTANKLTGTYRILGLDNPANYVYSVAPFYGDGNAPFTQILGQSLRLGDGSTSSVNPGANAAIDLGIAGVLEWDNLYIVNAPTVSSDKRVKQDILPLSDVERLVAIELKQAIKKYRMIAQVEKEGSDSKIHTGVIAQDVIGIFSAHGLDGMDYGIISYNPEADRYGIRYNELIMFILSAM